ncbi:MAG: hypothetical protein AAB438_03370 [Patescibacteria group bacterium]
MDLLKQINMFSQIKSTQKSLKQRNNLLDAVQAILIIICIVLVVVCIVACSEFEAEFPLYTAIVVCIFIALYARFEFWAIPFFAHESTHGGHLVDRRDFQEKFFTFKKHQKEDTNPLW